MKLVILLTKPLYTPSAIRLNCPKKLLVEISVASCKRKLFMLDIQMFEREGDEFQAHRHLRVWDLLRNLLLSFCCATLLSAFI